VFHHCLVGAKDLKQEISPYLEKWGWDKSVDEFLLYWFDSENVIDHQVLSHIRELRKKKITCALATNQEKYRTEYIIERMYFKDKFDHVYASAHIGVRKPDSGFYEHIHEQLGFPKEEIVFWDDNEENVRAAESYGFQAFVFEGYKPYLKQMKKILAQP
jgi:putative hydrolase of the HAD superfamily